jgi:hypothetical protein
MMYIVLTGKKIVLNKERKKIYAYWRITCRVSSRLISRLCGSGGGLSSSPVVVTNMAEKMFDNIESISTAARSEQENPTDSCHYAGPLLQHVVAGKKCGGYESECDLFSILIIWPISSGGSVSESAIFHFFLNSN